jgi:hypothetical protein
MKEPAKKTTTVKDIDAESREAFRAMAEVGCAVAYGMLALAVDRSPMWRHLDWLWLPEKEGAKS